MHWSCFNIKNELHRVNEAIIELPNTIELCNSTKGVKRIINYNTIVLAFVHIHAMFLYDSKADRDIFTVFKRSHYYVHWQYIVGDRSAEGIYTLTIRSAISILSIAFTFKCFIIESLIFAVVYDPPNWQNELNIVIIGKLGMGRLLKLTRCIIIGRTLFLFLPALTSANAIN